MSEEQTPVAQPVPEATVDPVVPEQQQTEQTQQLEVGNLIAESKKYRGRAQVAEQELSKIRKEVEETRISQLEEQEQCDCCTRTGS